MSEKCSHLERSRLGINLIKSYTLTHNGTVQHTYSNSRTSLTPSPNKSDSHDSESLIFPLLDDVLEKNHLDQQQYTVLSAPPHDLILPFHYRERRQWAKATVQQTREKKRLNQTKQKNRLSFARLVDGSVTICAGICGHSYSQQFTSAGRRGKGKWPAVKMS